MTIITSGLLLLDSALQPANGRIAGEVTARLTTTTGIVTKTPFLGVIKDGEIFGPDGVSPLNLPATTEGEAVRIWEIISGKNRDGNEATTTFARVVTIPDVGTVAYSDLLDVELPPASGIWVIPPYIQTLIDEVTADAEQVALDRVAVAADRVAVEAVPTTSDALMAAQLGTGGEFDTELSATFARGDQIPAPVLTDRIRGMKGAGIGVGSKAVVSLRFDDWQAAFKANVFPLLLSRGLPAGYAHISRFDQQSDWTAGVTWDDVKTWWKNGVEVWCHGTDHKDPTPNGYAGLVDQIVTAKAEIEARGLPVMGWMQPGATPLTAATPYGTSFLDLSDFASTPAGRLITSTYGMSCADTFGQYRILPQRVPYGMAHFTVSDGMSLPAAKLLIDNAIAAGCGVQLMCHAGNLGGSGMPVASYAALLDYIVTKRDAGLVEVLTPSGLANADKSASRFNMLNNGDFEGVTTGDIPYQGWQAGQTVETSGGKMGANFCRMTSAVTSLLVQRLGGAHNQIGVQQLGLNGGTMVLKAWVRSNGSATTTARFLITDYDDAARLNLDIRRPDIGTSWTQVHVPFSFPAECNRLTFAFGKLTGDGIDFDGLEIMPI